MAAAFISAGFRFDPTDADLMLGFLLPCLRSCAPGADIILLIRDADPFAVSPDALLHGRRARPDSDTTLFLILSPKSPLVVGDTGAWRRQRVTKGAAVSEDGKAVAWRRELFAYGADGETDGWVMGFGSSVPRRAKNWCSAGSRRQSDSLMDLQVEGAHRSVQR